MRLVAGVDPSLASTGIALVTQVDGLHGARCHLSAETFKPAMTGTGAAAEVARVASIVEQVCQSTGTCELVLIEGLALSSRTGKYAERAHLYYSLHAGYIARRKQVESVAPSSLKKLVTGSGRADKDAVLQAIRDAWGDLGWDEGLKTGRYDRADAAALAWVAAERTGFPVPALPGATASRRSVA